MKIRKGLPGGQYKPLSETDIQQIHETSLRVFSEIGIEINCPPAFELFRKAGAKVDESTRIVKISPVLLQELVDTAPSTVTLYGRGEKKEFDCTIGGSNVYLGTGGTALNVQESGSSESRPSTLRDIREMARLVDALDNIHFYMLNIYPNDLPLEDVDVNRFGMALNHTRKHIMGGVYTLEGVRQVIAMAELIAGSAQKLRRRPFVSMVTCVISPFKVDEHYGQLAMEIARSNIPLVVPSEPLCGTTAPITLAGNLVIQNVDTLSGVMLAQLANPGAPTLYGCISSLADLRDLKYLAGPVELGLMNAASAQMAQFYKLPLYSTAGMSDAKVNDAQAGYESAITNLMVALAGGNLIHDAAGFLEFCMTASFDKLVIDNEIIGMIMRAVEGITVNEKTLAFEEIKKVGPGGHFVSSPHTRRYMRSEHYQPVLSNREVRSAWVEAGAQEVRETATETVRHILGKPPTPLLSEDIRRRLKEEIPGLQAITMD